ncbi:probable BRI1 kinase inhibitor 1 [Miscanthus floridulus]|uniref:probable BRI1 kinase inhibitor 1 n=1 Tax=Miscanthus floridulus TaxID=154761 RepID=UPI00345A72B0
MSHRLGRVVSDISHSNSRSVTTDHHSLHHQSATTTTSNNNEGGNVGKATKQKLSLLISRVVSLSWTRSESSGETGGREKNSSSREQQEANSGTGGGRRRRGLEIVLAVRKYVAMVEQLLTSSYSASSSRPDVGSRRRDGRPHTFTSARHAGGNANAAAQSSSKRHRGRLSSAPASLRGSPATSGHLSVGESVTKASTTSSEVSTKEELQSAIQAAIAHCKNSVAGGGGGDKQQQQRKC